jgi:hypothetical protein
MHRPDSPGATLKRVLEGQLDTRAVRDDLTAFHRHVELETSAMRRSRNVLLAVATAFFAASSHDTLLVPMTSVTR